MARSAELSEQESPGHKRTGPESSGQESPKQESPGQDSTGQQSSGQLPQPRKDKPARERKSPGELWADGFGRVSIRSAQVLLVLAVAVVATYGLLQVRLLVIPIVIALILAAAAVAALWLFL